MQGQLARQRKLEAYAFDDDDDDDDNDDIHAIYTLYTPTCTVYEIKPLRVDRQSARYSQKLTVVG